ncbi:hypothetical protein PM085_15830 [Halorubrum ezzemoulense]|uniref:Uncharacterized protein n=1 Tax=Halorubrum ezzemoulense TaxID=337243 RepID=A0ABT4Z6Z8_HALEZ|nr:hypothetical protein [Halorubrum ezzemoulense]
MLTLLGFVPVVFSEDLAASTDSLGTELLGLFSSFAPVLGSVVIVASAGLFLTLFSEDSF